MTRALPLIVVLLLVQTAAASPSVWEWISGAAASNPDNVDVALYDGDRDVGTANPGSHGQAKAIAVGQAMRIELTDARSDGQPVTAGAIITIRQGSEEVATLAAQVIDGSGALLFTIPDDWGGNYHIEVRVLAEGTLFTQNEFKVQGFRCTAEDEECDGLDNDCDGDIDDIEPRSCGTSAVGACRLGSQTCNNAHWSACEGIVDPDVEICDGQDNDCDGLIDESISKACGSDVGACRSGTSICSAGTWGSCLDTAGPATETCDGVDNDCDGKVDEGCSCQGGAHRPCGSDVGQCSVGDQVCVEGRWEVCLGGVDPSAEICDGKDNDCDGQIDEELVQSCGENALGECRLGTQQCHAGAWSVCSGAVLPAEETCDGVDNDCDGQIDESLSRACGSGSCRRGTQACTEGSWGACSDISGPAPELCDGIDNDCDNAVDESLVRPCGCDCASAKVLLVKDTGHHNEDIDDFDYTIRLLRKQHADITVIDEPAGGLLPSHLVGYDLVWFINPGWPMDTARTLTTLKQWYDEGGALVLQGDDMTWGTGELSQHALRPLTGLVNQNNGLDQDYTVVFSSSPHPLLTYLGGERFTYKNDDIDTSVIDTGTADPLIVLATGTAVGKPLYTGPAILVRDGTGNRRGILLLQLLTLSEITPQWQAEALIGSEANWLLNKAGKCECGMDVGACMQSTQACVQGGWGACTGVPPIHEVCNGVDDDCNGVADDGITCECRDGQTERCGSDTGECTAGTRTCKSGAWGACTGGVGPATELCDGKDNDCDGIADNGIVLSCGKSMTAPCALGVQLCVNGSLTSCQGNMDPSDELCDGSDNDCDGTVDEDACECGDGQTRACPAIGGCSGGTARCDNGRWGACVGAATPSHELCNNVDDDCDGQIDNIIQSCGSVIGACRQGTQRCDAGDWRRCMGGVDPVAESCNGIDDNCDGLIDNGIVCGCTDGETRQCGTGIGACVIGASTCSGGQWGACSGGEASPEICDGKDNDCDGTVDEDLLRGCGESDIGACKLGTSACIEGAWGVCTGTITSSPEVCDGKDNNCDGTIDEGCDRVNPAFIQPQQASQGGNAGVTCNAGDGCLDGCVPSDPDCPTPLLYLTILDAPREVDANDAAFGVRARVSNNGSEALPNVKVEATSSDGWAGESQTIGSLDPGQHKDITLSYANILCPPDTSPSKTVPGSATLTLKAHSGDVGDVKSIVRDVNAPAVGALFSTTTDTLRACFIVGNDQDYVRDQLELEFELYDADKDEIVDLLSPIIIGPRQALLTYRDYPLRSLDEPKVYRARANLYEGGELFSKGYHVAETRTTVDLSDARLPPSFTLWQLIRHVLEVFV